MREYKTVIIRATYLLNEPTESAIADGRACKRGFANFGGLGWIFYGIMLLTQRRSGAANGSKCKHFATVPYYISHNIYRLGAFSFRRTTMWR